MSFWEQHKNNIYKYGHIYATICGLVVVNYIPQRPTNTCWHRMAVLYSHLLTALLVIVLPVYFVSNIASLLDTTDRRRQLLLVVSFANTLIKYVTVIVTYLANLAHYPAIRQITSTRQQLEDDFALCYRCDERPRRQFERMLLFKFALINLMMLLQSVNVWYLWWTGASSVRVYVAAYTFVLWNYTENMADYFYFINSSALKFLQQLHQQLLQLVDDAMLLRTLKHGAHMQHCCALSDRLDDLASVYHKIHTLYVDSVQLHQFQIFGLVLTTLISNLTNSFTLFNLLVKHSLASVTAMPAIVLNTLHAVAYYVDTYIVALVSENINTELRRIGLSMRLLNQFGKLDARLDRSIEQFSLQLLNTNSGIRICGLFFLDRRLTYLTAATALTYFVTLVQFDLNLSVK